MKEPGDFLCEVCGKPLNDKDDLFVKIRSKDNKEILRVVPVHIGECDEILSELEENKGHNVNGSFNFFSFKNNKSLEKYIGNGEIM